MTDNTTEELKEILQKISKKVIKLIPYLTILSGLMVWSYLNNIGRLDLLIDSFSINIGLVSLLISAVVLSLAIAITLILPSSILIFHSSMFPTYNQQTNLYTMVRLGIFYFILGIDISSTHSFYKKNNITTFSAINIYYNSSNIFHHFHNHCILQW